MILRTALPVDAILPELLVCLAGHTNAVVVAPPGSGKTTRIPPAIAAVGSTTAAGRVLVLEPRRVAARAAARYIADEQGWTLGGEVGWWIRFERRFCADTRILFATEGILLRWLQRDPFLDGVSTVIFDEFHERALAADLALALTRRVQREARADLGIIAMSATLDAQPLADFLDATVVRAGGGLHPIETRLAERPDDRPLETRIRSAVGRALGDSSGDVLVFLPGRAEILRTEAALEPLAPATGIELCTLYGDLPIAQQDQALRRSERRRIVLATNVAETSVTVQGVRAVVDSGLARQNRFDPVTGLDRLETTRISRAAADQRAGRAGREGPGLCLRLWTAADDLALRPFETPEIHRVDLAGALLQLAAWGESDLRGFDWYEPPQADRLERALRELTDLAALDGLGITALGRRLAALPLPPRLGRLVLEGERLEVPADAALIAALLAERDPFGGERSHRAGSRSDLLDRLHALDRRRHSHIFAARDQILTVLSSTPTAEDSEVGRERQEHGQKRKQEQKQKQEDKSSIEGRGHGGDLVAIGPRQPDRSPLLWKPLPLPFSSSSSSAADAFSSGFSSSGSSSAAAGTGAGASAEERLLRAVAAAYVDRLCRRRQAGSERAVMVGGRGVRLARQSAVRDAELFVAVVVDAGRSGQRSEGLVRIASAVEGDWLPDGLVTRRDELEWDARRQRVVCHRRSRLHDLVLDQREVPGADDSAASSLLVSRAAADLRAALGLDAPDLAALGQRLAFLSEVRPELGLPTLESALIELLPSLAAGRRSFAELRAAAPLESVLATLARDQRLALDREAPERIEVPSGSRIRIDYSDPARPVLAARIQELFGLTETPRLAGGKVAVLLHLLAPNGRPQQVTDDLGSFWKNTYPQVRRELAGRYPKHSWPDDPLSARPARRPLCPRRSPKAS